jgi:hypothetical protein
MALAVAVSAQQHVDVGLQLPGEVAEERQIANLDSGERDRLADVVAEGVRRRDLFRGLKCFVVAALISDLEIERRLLADQLRIIGMGVDQRVEHVCRFVDLPARSQELDELTRELRIVGMALPLLADRLQDGDRRRVSS